MLPILYTAAFNMVDLRTSKNYGKGAYPVYITANNSHEIMDAIRYGAIDMLVDRAFKNSLLPNFFVITLVISKIYDSGICKTHRYTINIKNIKTFRNMYIKARRAYIHVVKGAP